MDYMRRVEIEEKEEWRKWVEEIPALRFKEDWNVKVIPPFAGAIARFMIEKDGNYVSVYLDCYEKLGYFGEPYWEIYPYEYDTYRVAMNKTDELLAAIDKSLNEEAEK